MNPNETIAAVIAEIRESGRSAEHADGQLIEDYADRLEAAAARHDEILNANIARVRELEDMMGGAADALLGAAIKQSTPGNAAAMRDALEWVAEFVELGVDDEFGVDGQNLTIAAEKARAALAAPARNCDRFATVGAAHKAWRATDQERDFADWIFATAEGGAK